MIVIPALGHWGYPNSGIKAARGCSAARAREPMACTCAWTPAAFSGRRPGWHLALERGDAGHPGGRPSGHWASRRMEARFECGPSSEAMKTNRRMRKAEPGAHWDASTTRQKLTALGKGSGISTRQEPAVGHLNSGRTVTIGCPTHNWRTSRCSYPHT